MGFYKAVTNQIDFSEAQEKLFLCPLGAMSLPLLQSFIWMAGSALNSDLRRQFVHPGIDDGLLFTHLFAGCAQFFVGGILGLLTALSFSFSPLMRRLLLCGGGLSGTMVFGYRLSQGWSFEQNHCRPDIGCDLTSPLAVDFVSSVFLGLPLCWCLLVVFAAIVMRDGRTQSL